MSVCKASDCNEKVLSIDPKAVYCSDRCRFREAARRKYKTRSEKGLCVQCGGEMDNPVSRHNNKTSPKHCSKCQQYFKERYDSAGNQA